jgi:hypothetical protein
VIWSSTQPDSTVRNDNKQQQWWWCDDIALTNKLQCFSSSSSHTLLLVSLLISASWLFSWSTQTQKWTDPVEVRITAISTRHRHRRLNSRFFSFPVCRIVQDFETNVTLAIDTNDTDEAAVTNLELLVSKLKHYGMRDEYLFQPREVIRDQNWSRIYLTVYWMMRGLNNLTSEISNQSIANEFWSFFLLCRSIFFRRSTSSSLSTCQLSSL